MARHTSSTQVNFTPEQMYNLVIDMDRYPEFIPWIVKSRKYDIQENHFMSEMTFAFKGLRETFITEDHFVPNEKIAIRLVSGPFKNLESEWQFSAVDTGTRIDFFINFSFKNRLLDLTLGPLFGEASKRMVDAFKQRAMEMYQK
ncbi:MAG: type II toxin-antitoxin system RatA family toxin [Magnetococcales bacterium]|nr:type II toxin-antitoxin system RatA family toxin [Magnetococcales bacterium]MBF0438941.1 type II toxin-antitoxin system RatA family toxin [Magnetococcales bacterium]